MADKREQERDMLGELGDAQNGAIKEAQDKVMAEFKGWLEAPGHRSDSEIVEEFGRAVARSIAETLVIAGFHEDKKR